MPTLLLAMVFSSCSQKRTQRETLSLNGVWEFATTNSFERAPISFKASAPVPGLVDLAGAASPAGSAGAAADTPYVHKVYWYRRTFKVDEDIAEVALLKIYKSMYHTRVLLNKKLVGDNPYCFTPSLFNVKSYLNPKGVDNELIIGVGCYKDLPDTVVNGHDYEKVNYIPGIYDNVELQLTGYPYFSNIQTAPDLRENKVRVKALLETGVGGAGKEPVGAATGHNEIQYSIREVSTGKVVAQGDTTVAGSSIDVAISIPGCKQWSPEQPFLYELDLSTGGDNKKVKFGMRSFGFDKDKGIALLNGRPYYMRGTNICINRFYEDSGRAALPWDDAWVVRLHAKFRSMHWNSMRYAIGIPPERWYEIADSIGFLIQNEFPVWDDMRNVKAPQLAREYTQWMQEQWNHPSVVIWDAQNETVTTETGKAIQQVRHLDLSDRPWDNGWSPPQAATDDMECHPYMTYNLTKSKNPDEYAWTRIYEGDGMPWDGPNVRSPLPDGKKYTNPVVINEYEWAWLNRDGSPTTLTDTLYNFVLGKDLTREERFKLFARILSMDTEYWRVHRRCAAVLYFCGLGYSRPGPPRGQTSDNFTDVRNLVFEPEFERLMKPAFSPVGLMLDVRKAKYKKNSELPAPVYVINDTYDDVKDSLKLELLRDDKVVLELARPVTVGSLGREIFNMPLKMPDVAGRYILRASVKYAGEVVTSEREFVLK